MADGLVIDDGGDVTIDTGAINSIYTGGTNIQKMYVGSEEIFSAYVGSTQVYNAVIDSGGFGGDLYTIADTVVEGEPGARITANDGTFVGYYNSEEDGYYDPNGEWIDLTDYGWDFGLYLEEVYGITSDSGGGF